jgi:putative sterol carrier protein
VVRAPYRLWKDLLSRRADPVQAALTGRVRVEGDLESLVRRAQYRYIVEGALAVLSTEFPDEVRR